MKVYLVGHDFLYEMENLVRLFYPCDRIEMIENATGHEDPGQDDGAWLTIAPKDDGTLHYTVKVTYWGKRLLRTRDGQAGRTGRRLGVLFLPFCRP
ncbi:MAG: hypothetical protein ACLUUJ_03275 [Acutalibacteraceae bacterium]